MKKMSRQLLLAVSILAAFTPASAFEFLPARFVLRVSYSEGKPPDCLGQHIFAFQDSLGNDLIGHIVVEKEDRPSRPQTRILVYDPAFATLAQINLRFPVDFACGRDVDGDGKQELVFASSSDSASTVVIMKWPSQIRICTYVLAAESFPERRDGIWNMDLRIGPLMWSALTDRPALLLAAKNGFGRAPRGLVAIDPMTGTELWHYWIPNGLESVEVMSANGDSTALIIVGGNAPDNGAVFNDLQDNRSYLCAVDAYGNELWRNDYPGPFSTILGFPLHMKSDESPVIFAAFAAVHPDAGRNQLFRLDALTGRTLSTADIPGNIRGCGAYRWNISKTGRETFLVSQQGSDVLVYDEQLKFLDGTKRIDNVQCIGDVDGDGQKEVIGTRTNQRTYLLRHNLRVMGSGTTVFVRGPVLQRKQGEKYAYIWGETKDGICRVSIIRNPDYFMQLMTSGAGLIVILTVLGTPSTMWVVRTRRLKLRAAAEKARFDAWAAVASKLAHDIRTPLSVLRLSAQNLEQELETRYHEVPAELKHYFATFSEEANRVSEVARGFMTFTRSTPPILESTDLGNLMRRTVERRPHVASISVELNLDGKAPLIRVDAAQMVSLFDNLLSNSYCAMKEGGTLTVSLFGEQDLQKKRAKGASAQIIVIEIKDTGCGISAQDLPRVFDPYFTRSEGGTGIGLVIAKKVVEDHGGTISISSTLGVGTTVTIRLPLY